MVDASSDTPTAALGPPTEDPPAGTAELFGAAWPTVSRFATLLVQEGELRGLIGPREPARLWTRHLLNSAALVPFIPPSASRFADVGSGAGFPGVIVALLRPDLTVYLIEPMERRVTWLTDVVTDLELRNVQIRRARAEELHGVEQYDVVGARAVAHLKKLSGWTLPLVAPGGTLLALKGERAADEIRDACAVLKGFGVQHPEVHEIAVLGTDIPARVVVATRT